MPSILYECTLSMCVPMKSRATTETGVNNHFLALLRVESHTSLCSIPANVASYDGEIAGAHTWEQFQHRRVIHVFNTCRPF